MATDHRLFYRSGQHKISLRMHRRIGAKHSVKVYQVMMEKHFEEGADNPESFAVCALLHDLCKAQFYKCSTRNVKNEETGQWEKQPYFSVEDMFPYGHGEKSVFLIERFMRLKNLRGYGDPLAYGRL